MEIVRRPQLKSTAIDRGVPTLPLYRSAPSLEVRLEDFELYAIDRLRVLTGISDGLSRGKRPEEMEKLVAELWKANMRHPQASEVMNKDIISHFVLRLVYCRTYGLCALSLDYCCFHFLAYRVRILAHREDLRKWFLSMETALFRYRFRLQTAEAQRAVLAEFQLPYKAVTTSEFEVIKDKLTLVARSINQTLPTADAIFYKVPFQEVPELVAGRRVFLSDGYAYVAMNQVVSLVATQFRSLLSKALTLTNRKWMSTIREQEKDRLTPIVEALSTSYVGPDYSVGREFGEVSLKDIDNVAKSSFPLCMRHLFDKLREDHHLKHWGRMQLGLFLKVLLNSIGLFMEFIWNISKLPHPLTLAFTCYLSNPLMQQPMELGVGLKLDDALAFWKAEFSQKVGAERFDKEYAYSIRHNYGKEGKRVDYTPYSCQKIISLTPSVGDHHGCPYRHFSEENLRAALCKMGVNSGGVEDVMDKVRHKHYQLACTLTFEAIHGCPNDAGINHPNQYFSDSQKILKSKVKCLRISFLVTSVIDLEFPPISTVHSLHP
ncbi:unnamed protein product [Linum tenue]|uniref:DNA primase large subunit n=1 Tax=Linum tenue TaxID=586396 RepID=A0AAV0H7M5_9ROSI|nr:unnamed protein product [Linum tenue]